MSHKAKSLLIDLISKTRLWYAHNRWVFWSLTVIFVFGIWLRTATLDENLLFGFEQGRDALKAQDIYTLKDIVLIGPKTDLDGIFHGVWYYYLIAILYFVTLGNPLYVTYILAGLNAASVFVIYAIGRNIRLSRVFAIVASLLFAVSFNTVAYARWLSNVSPSIFVVSCFILSSILLIKHKKDIFWIPTFIFFGLLFHFELLHGLYAMVILTIFVMSYKLPLFTKNFWIGSIILLIINIPFVIFDLKNSFILSKGIIHYLTHSSLSPDPAAAVSKYFVGLVEELVSTLHTKMATVPFVLFFILLIRIFLSKNIREHRELQSILLFAVWSFPYMFLLKFDPLHQFYAGTSITLILIFVYGLQMASESVNLKFAYSFIIILTIGMSISTYQNIASRNMVFYHGATKELTFADQKKLIGYLIQPGKSFEWEAFTIPYFQSEAYRYLIPWYGRRVVGDKIDGMLSAPQKEGYYLIIEPSTAGYWLDRWIAEKDEVSKVISVKKFGEMTVQIRQKTN